MIRVSRFGIRVRTSGYVCAPVALGCRHTIAPLALHIFTCTPEYVLSSLRMYMCTRTLVLGCGNLHTAAAGDREGAAAPRRSRRVQQSIDLTSFIHNNSEMA